MTLADRIAIMKGGVIQQLASPDEIYNRPVNKYVADFIGSPSMTFFEGELKGGQFETGGISLPTAGYDFTGGQIDGKAIMGIRPEHVASGRDVQDAAYKTTVTAQLVEPMGSDTLIWADFAGKRLRVRLDGQTKIADGDQIEIGSTRANLMRPELRL